MDSLLAPIATPLGWLLAFFYSLIPNLGINIIMLTCLVMAVLLPLTAKQTRSMIAMQRIQPEIKKIQQQYKDDRQKQNEELMKFYQENNVNPLAGCLPVLLQAPIMLALFRVLHDIQDHIPTSGPFDDLFRYVCQGESQSNCTPKGIYFLGMDLTVSPANSGSVTANFIERLPYFIAVAAVVVSGWYQMWQTQRRQNRMGVNQNNPINKQMQMITRVFPIVFGWFSWIASSGLVVYFVTSSLWRIGQQHLVLNKYYETHPEEAGKKAGSGGKPPPGNPAPATDDSVGNPTKTATDQNGTRPKPPSRHTSQKKRKRRR